MTTPDVEVDDDDIWASDSGDENTEPALDQSNRGDMLSDLPTVRRQHMTDGYREGLAVGKAKVMQKGFDNGYPIGAAIALRVGKVLGCLEGILAAKDLRDEVKVSVKKMLEQAKLELAVSNLLKDMNDEQIMQVREVPDLAQGVLQKWETKVFGSLS